MLNLIQALHHRSRHQAARTTPVFFSQLAQELHNRNIEVHSHSDAPNAHSGALSRGEDPLRDNNIIWCRQFNIRVLARRHDDRRIAELLNYGHVVRHLQTFPVRTRHHAHNESRYDTDTIGQTLMFVQRKRHQMQSILSPDSYTQICVRVVSYIYIYQEHFFPHSHSRNARTCLQARIPFSTAPDE